MSNFTDRLLDASLKEYTRVTPQNLRLRRPISRAWWWLLAPVAVAVVAVLLPHQTPAPPPRLVAHITAPEVSYASKYVTIAPVPRHEKLGTHFRTLSAAELAHINLPADLFVTPEEKPMTDLQMSDLSVKPLESANPIPAPKE